VTANPHEQRRALLTADTSRINKIHLATGWRIPWRWSGLMFRSRIEVQLDGKWRKCKSFDEDVFAKLEAPHDPR
jgi:hypothetical protein